MNGNTRRANQPPAKQNRFGSGFFCGCPDAVKAGGKKIRACYHFEGGYRFRSRIYFEATPPETDQDEWKLKYGYESISSGAMPESCGLEATEEGIVGEIPIVQPKAPGITARLKITARVWD